MSDWEINKRGFFLTRGGYSLNDRREVEIFIGEPFARRNGRKRKLFLGEIVPGEIINIAKPAKRALIAK